MMRRLCFLGPEGSFTHQAAMASIGPLETLYSGDRFAVEACADVPSIMRAVELDGAWGILAWENNVEGPVVPNLDALIDADNALGLLRIGIDVVFDAFVTRGFSGVPCEVSAHPHGLAQCRSFIRERGLHPLPAASNAAACRDLRFGQVALGPSICGALYGLDTLAAGVQDYAGAHTGFLVLAPRDGAASLVEQIRDGGVGEYETVIAFIPLCTGSGVLADLLDVLRDGGLNMTSFMSRPIKGHDGTYSFIATIDAAPWQPRLRAVLEEVVAHGDWVKTLAVYPRRERENPPVDEWMLPRGGYVSSPEDSVIRRDGDSPHPSREDLRVRHCGTGDGETMGSVGAEAVTCGERADRAAGGLPDKAHGVRGTWRGLAHRELLWT